LGAKDQDKDKDQDLGAKDQDKDLGAEDKDQDLGAKDQDKDNNSDHSWTVWEIMTLYAFVLTVKYAKEYWVSE